MLKEQLIDYDPETGRVAHPPRQIFLELTGRCNLACVHCSKDYGSPEAENERDMPMELLDRLQPWLEGARLVNLNVVGESMMAPTFDEAVRRACGAGADVSFNTNGLYLNEERSRFLVETGVHSITISLDGTEFNRRVRGFPYQAVVKRIETLARVRDELGSETPHLALAYTLFRDNLQELPQLLREMLPKVRFHAVHVQPLVVFYETLRNQNIYDAPSVDAVIAECRDLCKAHGVELVLFRSQFVQDERNGSTQELVRELGPFSEEYGCTDPFFEIKIRSTGSLLACSFGREPDVNLLRDDPDEVWNGEWYCNLRKALYAKRFEGRCANCPCLFGSFENQLTPLREGVHHSRAEQFLRG